MGSRMGSRWVLVASAAAALTIAGGVALAGEKPTKVELELKGLQLQKGDVVSQSFTVLLEREVTKGDSLFEKIDDAWAHRESGWTADIRRDELDARGRTKKATVMIGSGYVRRDDETDQSLAGARMEISNGRWKDAHGHSVPSGNCRDYMNDVFVPDRLERSKLDSVRHLAPRGAVGVGEAWEIDASALAVEFEQLWGYELDESEAKGTCTLDSTRQWGKVRGGRLEMKMKVPVEALPEIDGKSDVELAEDVVLEIEGTYDMQFGGRLPECHVVAKASLRGKGKYEGRKVSFHVRTIWMAGNSGKGWIPEPSQMRR